jgi:anion-transporting  ArsA/GET3 family ATPase
MVMETEASLREYLGTQLKVPLLARLGPLARTLDFVATAAPGVREILTIGKLTWEVRDGAYDLVVVDAPATGHIVGQLRAPDAIAELVHVGPVREQTLWMREVLTDPARTGVVVVAAPEEMPVTESLDLIERLRDTEVAVAAVVVNRVLPELFGRGEEAQFEELAAAGSLPQPIVDAARLAVTMRRTRTAHLDRLRAGVDPTLPILYVPELFARAEGLRTTSQIADRLGEEL